jgi:isochorismate pyruvate lyase
MKMGEEHSPDNTGYNTLAEVRAAIDALDRALVTLLSERFRCISAAARIKKQEGQDALIAWRVEDVVQKIREQADQTGFDPDLAETLWRDIIRHCVAFEQKKLKPHAIKRLPVDGKR